MKNGSFLYMTSTASIWWIWWLKWNKVPNTSGSDQTCYSSLGSAYFMYTVGHQDKCFPRFAPTFIPGAGQTDGEILETLWAVLNEVGCTTRTMTLAHRSEVLDAHMLDNNWKKMINMGIFTMFISLLFLTEVQSVISARSGSKPRQGLLRAQKLSRN